MSLYLLVEVLESLKGRLDIVAVIEELTNLLGKAKSGYCGVQTDGRPPGRSLRDRGKPQIAERQPRKETEPYAPIKFFRMLANILS